MPKQISPYQCAFSLNNDILFSASNIAYEAGRLSATGSHHCDLEVLAKEVRAIFEREGYHFTPSQVRALNRGEEISQRPEVNAFYRLAAKMPRLDPYDSSFLAEYEASMYPAGVPSRMSRKVEGFPYAIPLHVKIEPMMKGLYTFANNGKGHIAPMELGCLFYFEVMAIQPYSTLTRPLAAYLLKLFLVSYCKDLMDIPLFSLLLTHQEEVDSAYAEAVEKADTAPFVLCILRLVERGIAEAQRKSLRSKNNGTPLVTKMLSKMEEGKFYSAQELLGLLGLTSRLGLQKNYLRPALDAKLIAMSNPLTPTDRNQRYKKV